jgi:hypothetical protein
MRGVQKYVTVFTNRSTKDARRVAKTKPTKQKGNFENAKATEVARRKDL